MLKKAVETKEFITSIIHNFVPSFGIILGSGLGNFANKIDIKYIIPYKDIPNFPISTVSGHKGNLLFGFLQGKQVVAMQGRFHYYEGYTMKEVAFPVVVMKMLGISHLIVSNAAGGVNPAFQVGDIMMIKDHINLVKDNPLIGKNEETLGPRFPSMHEAYDKEMIRKAVAIAQKHGIRHHTGVYAGLSGPAFETPAEYKYIHIIGGDAVGMSTVPEVMAAKHVGLKVFGLSAISNVASFEKMPESTHEEVLEAMTRAASSVELLVEELINITNPQV